MPRTVMGNGTADGEPSPICHASVIAWLTLFVMGQVRRYEFGELEKTDNFAVTVTGSTSDFLFFNVMRVDGSAVTGMEYSLDIIVAV
ncbi:hypothetical protein [Shimia sp.]|uniref:hypothetical protein n=1 Tax=Shimia sp. TaxID=1954381 RepID=UPI0025D95602|nr:hypothetical protein [Shimia sp.]